MDEPKKDELVIPDEAKALAEKIIGEAVKLIPQSPPSSVPGPSNDAVMAKLDVIEKNLYCVFCITEKILGQLVSPEELKKMGVDVDRKVMKKRMGVK